MYIALTQLYAAELRYEEALDAANRAAELARAMGDSPYIADMLSLVNYYIGNLDEAVRIAQDGMTKWPKYAALRNNFAFALTRKLLRDMSSRLWDDPDKAAEVFDQFLTSILQIGAFGTAHFNYALLLYWAANQGRLEDARRILAKHGRPDLVEAPDITVKAFERAKNAFKRENDHFHEAMAVYFMERAQVPTAGGLKARILDELLWDADNFFSHSYAINRWRLSLLTKRPGIDTNLDMNHLATLKRWKREVQSSIRTQRIQDGGGAFIRWEGAGIVLNPGAGFLNNFQRRGYSVSEIDAILVTSSHYSAYEELTELLDLIDDANRFRTSKQKVEVLLERRVFHRFPDIHLRSVPSILGPQVLTGEMMICGGRASVKAVDPCCDCTCSPVPPGSRGRHHSPSVITLIELRQGVATRRTIGVICDMCTAPGALGHVEAADVLLLSLGPVTPYDFLSGTMTDAMKTQLMKLFQDDPVYMESFGISAASDINSAGHRPDQVPRRCEPGAEMRFVGIEGLLAVAESLKGLQRLVVLGDLPLYLGDKRHRIAAVLNRAYNTSPLFMTEDMGLVIRLPTEEVLCEFEHRFVPQAVIDEECLEGDPDGPVKHFCADHRRAEAFEAFLSRTI